MIPKKYIKISCNFEGNSRPNYTSLCPKVEKKNANSRLD
jgi:hypothetical protein